jgi:ribosomal-protein-alanine N-acetyltransferase
MAKKKSKAQRKKERIEPMDETAARAIYGWRYEPPYDLYNMSTGRLEAVLRAFVDPKNAYYALRDDEGDLVAYCCFGPDGQVPGGDYGPEAMDIGLGVRPDLAGQGRGIEFVQAVLDFGGRLFSPAQGRAQPPAFRVTIAEFNRRAQRVWQKAGFRPVGQFARKGDGLPFVVLVRENRKGEG